MKKPNIMVMTCHDLGRHLGCYGAEVETPHLDRLAGEGMRFRKAFTTAPLCSPSRASLHTGKYPHQVGVNGLSHPPFKMEIEEPEAHLAHHLKRQGYEERILVGFQHLCADSEKLGYSEARFRLGAAESIAEEACTVLDGLSAEEPFYLEVGFFETHRPFDWGGVEAHPPATENPFPYLPDSEAARAEAGALGAAVAALDAGVGRILKTMEERGLGDDTWVIFVTDHGLPFPRAKGTLYDPGLETALIMRWPNGGIPAGAEAGGLVSLVDIVPTILGGIGVGNETSLDGMDLWPWIQSGTGTDGPRKRLFAEKTYHTGYEPMRGIRTEQYKLIVNFETGPAFDVATDIIATPTAATILDQLTALRPAVELYDLDADPLEKVNLAGEPGYEEVVKELREDLFRWMRETEDPLLQGPVCSEHWKSLHPEG